MAAGGAAGSRSVLLRPVTFVTGNTKKLEEARAILGHSIPFHSLKLDCTLSIPKPPRPFFWELSISLKISMYPLSLSPSNKSSVIISHMVSCVASSDSVPELQGEPEDISKEKARLAAIQVVSQIIYHIVYLYFLSTIL